MRTIIDIPDKQVEILNQLSKKKRVSRAEIIRLALVNYIDQSAQTTKSYSESFGLWKDQKLDAIDYQRKLRNEW